MVEDSIVGKTGNRMEGQVKDRFRRPKEEPNDKLIGSRQPLGSF